MVLLAEQMRIINRLFSIKFKEEEFRLSEELTYKRVHERLRKLDSNELLDAYYTIYMNYFKRFNNINNKYLNTLYVILLKVCEEKDIDLDKYIAKKKMRIYRIDCIAAVLCGICVVALRNVRTLNIILLVLNFLIIINWKKWISIVSKLLKVKQIKIQEYRGMHTCMFLSSMLITILQFRVINSILYLFFGYLFTIVCYAHVIYLLDKQIYKKLTKVNHKIYLKVCEYAILALMVLMLIPPLRDTIGYYLGTSDIRYFEGICTETRDRPFGFKEAMINDIEVVISIRDRDVTVGNFYRIIYGNQTKAIVSIEEIDILGKSKMEE